MMVLPPVANGNPIDCSPAIGGAYYPVSALVLCETTKKYRDPGMQSLILTGQRLPFRQIAASPGPFSTLSGRNS